MGNDCDDEEDFSDFDAPEFDELINQMWAREREDRINELRQSIIHTIQVRRYNYVRLKFLFLLGLSFVLIARSWTLRT